MEICPEYSISKPFYAIADTLPDELPPCTVSIHRGGYKWPENGVQNGTDYGK